MTNQAPLPNADLAETLQRGATNSWFPVPRSALSIKEAATDAPNFGFPSVVFGPGSIAQAHSTNEFVDIGQMVAATKIYLRAALDLLVVS